MRKMVAIYTLLFLLLSAAMLAGGFSNVERSAGEYRYVGPVLFWAFFFTGTVVLAMILLMMRDPFQRPPKERLNLLDILAYVLVALALAGPAVLLRRAGRINPLNATENTPPGSPVNIEATNGTAHYPEIQRVISADFLSGALIVAAIGAVLIMLLVYTAIKMREAMRVRKIQKELERFERRMEEGHFDVSGDPKEVVIESYRKAVLFFEMIGLPYKKSWTHWEHYGAVNYMRDAFRELTVLFEKAKYAPEKVTSDDARRAYGLYRKIRGEKREG